MASILYLHGFLSSPSSLKANQTRAYLLQHFPETVFICPELSNSPGELEGQLKTLLSDNPDLLNEGLKVIGSSMGGYLATWLSSYLTIYPHTTKIDINATFAVPNYFGS